jgi:hypothetical protein
MVDLAPHTPSDLPTKSRRPSRGLVIGILAGVVTAGMAFGILVTPAGTHLGAKSARGSRSSHASAPKGSTPITAPAPAPKVVTPVARQRSSKVAIAPKTSDGTVRATSGSGTPAQTAAAYDPYEDPIVDSAMIAGTVTHLPNASGFFVMVKPHTERYFNGATHYAGPAFVASQWRPATPVGVALPAKRLIPGEYDVTVFAAKDCPDDEGPGCAADFHQDGHFVETTITLHAGENTLNVVLP